MEVPGKTKGSRMKVESKQSLKNKIIRLKKVIDVQFEMMAQKDVQIHILKEQVLQEIRIVEQTKPMIEAEKKVSDMVVEIRQALAALQEYISADCKADYNKKMTFSFHSDDDNSLRMECSSKTLKWDITLMD